MPGMHKIGPGECHGLKVDLRNRAQQIYAYHTKLPKNWFSDEAYRPNEHISRYLQLFS